MRLLLLICCLLFVSSCGTIRDYREAKKAAEEKSAAARKAVANLPLESVKASSENQSWFYVLAAIFIVGVVVSIIMKSMSAAIACGVGAGICILLPSVIESIHKVMTGMVWFFNGSLALLFCSIVGWVGYKMYHHPSKKAILKRPSDLPDIQTP